VHAGRWGLEIYSLNLDALIITLADKVQEVTRSTLALTLDLDSLFTLCTQVLEALVEADSKVVSRNTKDLANRRGDAGSVGVNIIHLSQLSRDLGGETRGQRIGNLL
jgi:hypothetical protein